VPDLILVRATVQVAVVVVTCHIMLLSMLLVLFLCVIKDLCNDGGNIIVLGDRGGIICKSIV